MCHIVAIVYFHHVAQALLAMRRLANGRSVDIAGAPAQHTQNTSRDYVSKGR